MDQQLQLFTVYPKQNALQISFVAVIEGKSEGELWETRLAGGIEKCVLAVEETLS